MRGKTSVFDGWRTALCEVLHPHASSGDLRASVADEVIEWARFRRVSWWRHAGCARAAESLARADEVIEWQVQRCRLWVLVVYAFAPSHTVLARPMLRAFAVDSIELW